MPADREARDYTITMGTKPLLIALLAACGVTAGAHANTEAAAPPIDEPDKAPPQPPKPKDQHFCCEDVDLKNFTGEGCQLITELQVALCDTVLYCEGNWAKKDGKVACD